MPLLQRKATLAALPGLSDASGGGGTSGGTLGYSDHVEGSGAAFHEQACGHELEGIISKKRDGRYVAGLSSAWVKSKCLRRQEFVVVGYTDPSGSRTGFGALLLGTRVDGELVYCGRVGTGFDEATLKALSQQLTRLDRKTAPVAGDVPRREMREAHWVTPELVAEVEFSEWTDDRRLRHPRFLGLREDKPAEEVVLETPRDVEELQGSEPSRSKAERNAASADQLGKGNTSNKSEKQSSHEESASGDSARGALSSMRLTHPDRVLYPGQGVTKRDLAEFYADIAEWVLPHVTGRPLSLVRCPRGRSASCFYQKHLGDTAPDELSEVSIKDEKGKGSSPYAVVDDLPGLLSLVQIGVLEIHPWGSRADDPEKPDRLFFDLDPGPDTTWQDVIDAAMLFREALDHLGLESFCKTTGGKGVHVVVPIDRRTGWDDLKAFARALAEQVAGADPDAYTTNMSKAKRPGKVFLDYLRNGRGATAVAGYSTRSREGATVSVPIRWDELTASLAPDQYNVTNLRRRLGSLKADPWKGFFDVRQSITKPMRQAVGL